MAYNSLLFLIIWGLKLYQTWPVEALSSWLLCYSDMPLSCFEQLFTFWYNKIFRFYVILIFLFQTPINHFSEEPWFLSVGDIRNKDLGALYVHCYLSFSLPVDPSVGGTGICIHIHNLENHEFTLISMGPFLTMSLPQWKPWLPRKLTLTNLLDPFIYLSSFRSTKIKLKEFKISL